MPSDSSQERPAVERTPFGRVRIFAVVVLYGQRPSESVTLATLSEAIRHSQSMDCAVMIYDNSAKSGTAPEDLPHGFCYLAATANRGLLGAYEAAMKAARAEGFEWLLTLDQDTSLPSNFFSAIASGFAAARKDARIAAIVPHLAEGEKLLSPAYVGIGRARALPASFSGVPPREVRAFNSAALLRVQAIDAIGGFDPCFWLDHLDSWLHHQLFLQGWRMHVLGSVHLQHHFSLLNYRERVSVVRFQNFLSAESAYNDLYGSWLERTAYTAQLAVRLANQFRRRESPEIRHATVSAWMRRLTLSRRRRLREWRRDVGCTPSSSAFDREDA